MPELSMNQQEVVDKADVLANVPPRRPDSTNFHRETQTIIDPITKKPRKTPGRLSRKGMLQALAAGYHIQIPVAQGDGTNGVRMITDPKDLPSDTELAEAFNEEVNVEDLQASNEGRIRQLKAENDRLEALKRRQRTGPQAKKAD